MGDFNEVRYKYDRFGSVFNVHGANAFNSFIANAGLEEVPLGGSSFTWCHKSATKMSKLDRFLISENLLITCPNITAITLERYLSDHRPILLRESRFDYGPSPFRFYHHWLEVDGFNNFVEDMWSVAPGNNSNPLRSMAMKLKFLKLKIKEWNQRNMKDLKSGKAKLKEDLEALDADIDKACVNGVFKGVQLNPSLNLSHMFYADDAVFVGQWCDDNINILTHVLDCFYWASGLRINMSKSKIMGILVADDKVKSATTKLGCLMLNTPFSYLGTKVGGSMSRTHAWEEVIDKVRSRLSRWKMKTLSIGGRLTLLKSVLGSMPIFHMSIFKAPLSVIRQLESIRSHFFNGHDSASRKASWIKWDCVLAPKEKGGLGVSSLYALNRALMFKWVWRFYSQNSSLWARVMKAIHGDDGRIGINFLDFMPLKPGNGNNISFWNNNWIGGNTLKNLYPRIYALENSKQVTVCAKLADIALDASFRRKPRGGIECIQFNEMLVLMQDVSLTPISDRWIWSLEGSGDFSVASTRKAIDDKRLPAVNSKTRWIKYVP
ncbi:RNA-directed DNA polymerase, eukaryota, reverse transcriptase zinc-binding domain protein [Tanacetum coccineum]